MKSLNEVKLIGHLGKDVELRYQGDGGAVGTISVATGAQWKDKDTGEKVEKTEWHRCVSFGKQAELIDQFCKKGARIYVSGRLQTRKWTDKEGEDHYTTEVVVDDFIALDKRDVTQSQGDE